MDEIKPHIISVTVDTVDGPEYYEVDAATIALDRLEALLEFHPELTGLYYERLFKERKANDDSSDDVANSTDSGTDGSKYENSLEPTIYFFTDKSSQEVVAIHMYSIFGISTMDRSIQDWRPSSREDESVYPYIYGDYDTYKYVWGSEPYDINDPNWDPADIQDWYPIMSKKWARGETVTVDDLEPFATKLDEVFVDYKESEEDFDVAMDLPPEHIREELSKFLDVLHPRESAVLSSRFGLGDGVPKSYGEIAESFAVEPQRIQQIEVETLDRLRGLNLSLELMEFLG